jgi:hydrogenase expression/formation protein HypD
MEQLAGGLRRPARLMEVCGTHTVSIFRSGLRSLFPDNLRLVSGPGCPVCVTAQRHLDAAIELGAQRSVILATYGDMMRVPGRLGSLERLRAGGADVQVVTSARASLELARRHPSRPVVFLGVGFETTAPATAATVLEAAREGVENWSVLAAHKLVVPAMMALLEGGDVPLDGFLCPGHVSVIIGSDAYRPVVERHRKACVVAGFETEQILLGMVALLRQVADGRAELENVYTAVVRPNGNPVAQRMLAEVFVPADTAWRALGIIPVSGLELAPAYRRFDALERFGVKVGEDEDHPACRCGEVIQGKAEPRECGLFGTDCTPLNPIGPCMVSSEGTCAAWYRYAVPARLEEARA